ncbi:hypothetical protein ACTVZO_17775 [Streptomyces sp. IBSNAI002]|uniref:hypothetical protein n=1 Tax=Streptomyces sp. IBSNAI002 TaxID=3457500 RepID=UPI003FD5AD78
MAETIYVRGEGGAVIAMDLPLPESIAERYERGQLVRVHSDGSPYGQPPAPAQAPREPAQSGEAAQGEAPAEQPDGGPSRAPGRPAVNAVKADWIAFVVSQGHMSAEDAANLSKADLIDLAE